MAERIDAMMNSEPWLLGVSFPCEFLYQQARNYTKANRSPEQIGAVVIHTAEVACTDGSAWSLAKWAAGSSAPHASWHFAVDPKAIAQSVLCKDVAWHVRAPNPWTIGIELCGRAGYTEADWQSPERQAMLRNAAVLASALCDVCGLELVHAVGSEINKAHFCNYTHKEGGTYKVGLFGHVDATTALNVPGGHWDPGPDFPWFDFLEMMSKAREARRNAR